MIEAYILGVVSALGYFSNKISGSKNVPTVSNINKTSRKDTPSMTNIYESQHVASSQKILQQAAAKKYKQSTNPVETRVINRNYQISKDDQVSSLTGNVISKSNFTHANMVPYFGGRVKQNMDVDANNTLLESFTGTSSILNVNKSELNSSGTKLKTWETCLVVPIMTSFIETA